MSVSYCLVIVCILDLKCVKCRHALGDNAIVAVTKV